MLRPLVALLVLTFPVFAAPVPKALKKTHAPPVAGTSWQHGNFTYTFEENGRLSYRVGNSNLNHECGSWKLDGDTLTWDTHNHYADFTTTFADGVFTGPAKSAEGKTWAVTLRPAEMK